MKKPNIIFLMTDQQRWDCLGVINPRIKTPNLDRLAKGGIVFNQAVSQCPMCVPSRNSMMMGLYPSQIGVRSNAGGLFLEDRLPSIPLPEIMRSAGYQTAGFGKTHWNHGVLNPEPPTRGFEVRAEGQPRKSAQYEKGAVMMDDINPEGLKAYFEETASYGSGEENVNGYIGCTSKLKTRDHRDGFIAEQCLEFLDNGIDPERPLFLYLSFIKPHAGFNVPKEFEDLYDIEDIPDTMELESIGGSDNHIEELKKNYEPHRMKYESWHAAFKNMTKEERRRTILRYWANCTWLDSYFGKVIDRLEELGRLDNCLFVYTSDHGDMMGERNLMFSKYCLYESSVRVPLILSGSYIDKEKRGTFDERPAELTDLVPTLMKAAGLVKDPILPGLDLLGEEQRAGAFSEFHGGGSEEVQPGPAYMWRKKEWKLIVYVPGTIEKAMQNISSVKGELYNLVDDPQERNNLYSDGQYAIVREQLKTELLMYLACVWAKGPFYYDTKGFRKLGYDIGLEGLKR